MLVEREAELGVVLAALDAAADRRGSLVIVEGEAGVGKTRLLAEAHAAALERGLETLTATGGELEHQFPFGVVLQLFEARVTQADSAERETLLGGAARRVAPLLSGAPSEPAHSREADQCSLLHGLWRLCSNLTEQSAHVLFVDDSQWADAASLRFLLYLTRRIHTMPLAVILGITRGERLGESNILNSLGTPELGTTIRLGNLTADAVGTYLRSLLGDVDRALLTACQRVTGGNPLYLHELAVDLLVRDKRPSAEAVSQIVPESVLRSVALRLERVAPQAVPLARAAAVLSNEAELRRVATLAGLEQTEAVKLADTLMSLRILGAGTPLEFAYPIARNAVYQGMSDPERAEAHHEAAHVLSQDGAALEEVARQLIHARRAGDAWAVDVLVRVAGNAMNAGDPVAATEFLRRALTEPPDPEQRPAVVLALGEAEVLAGHPAGVERLGEAYVLVTDPNERARVALAMARAYFAQGRPEQAASALDRGFQALPNPDGTLRAELDATDATLRRLLAIPNGRPLASETSPDSLMADTPGDRLGLARVALDAAFRGAPAADVREMAVRALGRGELLQQESADGIGCYLAVWALLLAEDLRSVDAAVADLLQEARGRGSVLGFATACHFRALANFARGRIDDASADAGRALAAQRHGWCLGVPSAAGVRAEWRLERGETEAAEHELEQCTGVLVAKNGVVACRYLGALGRLEMLRGAPHRAMQYFLEAGDRLEEVGAVNPAVLPWRSMAGVAAMHQGDLSKARDLLDEELSRAIAFGAPTPIGRVLRARAAGTSGAEAAALLTDAADVLEASPAKLELARALVDLGAALRRSRRRKAARGPLLQGLALARQCGALALVQHALEESIAAGARPRRFAVSGPESLTPRELQAARLAAQGRSNRQIAEALFVTLKTVEWHLRHVYEKLGVRSRREIAEALAHTAPQEATRRFASARGALEDDRLDSPAGRVREHRSR